MLTPPERQLSQHVVFSYSASTTFSKSARFIPGNEGSQIGCFVVGPPLRPETRRRLPPGRGAQMSQNLFKKTLFEPISVCCWPRLLVKIAPNRSFFTFGRPLPARNTSKVASGEGGPEVSKCMPEFTFGANLGVLLAQTFGEN